MLDIWISRSNICRVKKENGHEDMRIRANMVIMVSAETKQGLEKKLAEHKELFDYLKNTYQIESSEQEKVLFSSL